MAVRPRGEGFQADIQFHGRRVREQFDTEAAARAWEAAALDALKRGKPVPKPDAKPGAAGDTVASLLETVIKTEWRNKSGCVHSIRNATRFVAHVGPALSPKAALTQANVDEFVAHIVDERQVSGSTVNRYLSAVSVLGKKAYAYGLIDRRLDLPWQKEGESRLRWYSDEEEALILQTLRLWNRPRLYDFFAVLVDTGLRTWTEAVQRLQWRDINANPRMVTVLGKNSEYRSVPLTARAWEAIERQRAYKLNGPFHGLDQEDARRVYDRLRVTFPQLADTVWYTARHTFASRLVQNGVDLYRVQKLMGHKSFAITQRYAKLAPKQLIDAIAILENRNVVAQPRVIVDNTASA